MQRACARCVNDATVPGTVFDARGVCNYCREYERLEGQLTDLPTLERLWRERLEIARRRARPYDALMGLSGGKDSTFVLYHLVKTYGLRVKAFTGLNGFLTPWARRQIEKVTSALGVDHEYVAVPETRLRDLYDLSLRYTGAPCAGCSVLFYTLTVSLAQRQGIPLAVHGRSRSQMLRSLLPNGGPDAFADFLYAGLRPRADVDLKALYGSVVANVRSRFPAPLVAAIEADLPEMGEADDLPEFLPYFLYHPYDKREIVEFLNENLDYALSPDVDVFSHLDCDVHDAAAYLKEAALGRAATLPEVSVLIREGAMTRGEGLARVEADRFRGPLPEESLRILGTFTGRSREGLVRGARRVAWLRRHRLAARAYLWLRRAWR